MNYHAKGMYQWDTWYCVRKGTDEVHAFYLQYPRPGGASWAEADCLGHAVSYNLLDWEELPPALCPEPRGQPGDMANWTGSTIEHDGRYYMYYTIRSSAENGRVQSIGLAVSDDLTVWRKHSGNPVITPDPRWYNTVDNPALGGVVDCRDFMVVKHDKRPGYFGVFATRTVTEELPEGAVFAGAYSEDMVSWEQTSPVFRSSEDRYSIVEMPDLFKLDGKWYLTWLEDNKYGNRDVMGDPLLTSGTAYAVSDRVEGPYVQLEDSTLLASMGMNGLSCRTVDFKGKKYVLFTMPERVGQNPYKPAFGVLGTPKEVRVVDGKLRACYAGILDEKLGAVLLDGNSTLAGLDFRNTHETPGKWAVEGGRVSGWVQTAWARHTFDASGSDFLYSADICLASGVAGGLLMRQDGAGAGVVALLDFRQQAVTFHAFPRFELVDFKRLPLEYGRTYNLKVMCDKEFYEVFVDDVLCLQFCLYYTAAGRFGLLLDRAEGAFSGIKASELLVDDGKG